MNENKTMITLDTETLTEEIDKFMQKHIFDNLKVIQSTIKSYIEISEKLQLPAHFLEDILTKINIIIEGE